MKKFSLRVSGARVGDAARPIEDGTTAVAPRAPRFGLKVHRTVTVRPTQPILPEDYATAEDYE